MNIYDYACIFDMNIKNTCFDLHYESVTRNRKNIYLFYVSSLCLVLDSFIMKNIQSKHLSPSLKGHFWLCR